MLEPQNKINVEFQPSKKMKKRRELDALVCNGKVRRKSKSGHELLRTESESSEIDEFSIAAQKTLFRNRGRSSCSSCKTVLAFLLIGACLVICAGLIWLHFDMKNSIQILQEQIHSVEAKNTDSTTEIGTFKKQIDDLTKQLEKSDSGDLTQFKDLNKRIEELTKSSETLKSVMSVDSKQELDQKLEQLTQIPVISQTVATIGSDVETLKTKIEELNTFKQTASKQIEEINQKALQSDDRESKPFNADQADLSNKFDTLQQTVGNLNNTLGNRINTLESVFNVHQMKFDILQNKTSQLQLQISQGNQIQPPKSGTVIPEDVQVQPPQSGTVIPEDVQKQIQLPESGSGLVIPEAVQKQIEQKVEDSVRQMLLNKTEGTSDSSLNSILTNMDNITTMVRNLKDQFVQLRNDHTDLVQPEETTKGDNTEFVEFKTIATERLETLNKSVDHLSQDVSTLMHKFTLNQNSLTQVTAIVEGIKKYISILETKIGMPMNTTVLTDDPDLGKLIQAENISIPLDAIKNETGSTVAPPTTTPRPIIHMKLINNIKDLELGLHRWDKNGDGVLDGDEIGSLQDYMPDPPTPDQMKQFDFNLNGSIDLDELNIALGYKPYPSEDERKTLADLG